MRVSWPGATALTMTIAATKHVGLRGRPDGVGDRLGVDVVASRTGVTLIST